MLGTREVTVCYNNVICPKKGNLRAQSLHIALMPAVPLFSPEYRLSLRPRMKPLVCATQTVVLKEKKEL